MTGVKSPMRFTDSGNGHKGHRSAFDESVFTNGVLWQQDAESFVCMEPWNGWANSVNEAGHHIELNPGETKGVQVERDHRVKPLCGSFCREGLDPRGGIRWPPDALPIACYPAGVRNAAPYRAAEVGPHICGPGDSRKSVRLPYIAGPGMPGPYRQ